MMNVNARTRVYSLIRRRQDMAFCWNTPLHIDGNACIDPRDMRAWEAAEIRQRPGAGLYMMEVAGREVAMHALHYHPETVLVFCGSGNNGGDGFVAAHYLRHAACNVRLFVFSDEIAKTPDARTMFSRVLDLPRTTLLELSDVSAIPAWKDHKNLLVIDAIFGTGYRPSHSMLMTRVYQCIEELRCPIISVDIPSGIDASTGFRGEADDPSPPRAIHATETITFGAPKTGHFCGDGPKHTGSLHCVDIGLGPWPETGLRKTILSDEYVDAHYPAKRAIDVHKGMCGHVYVVGGCDEMPGAAILASRAALRAGAGLVTLASTTHLAPPDEIMRLSLTNDGVLDECKLELIFQKADVILAGPGLGRTENTIKIVAKLLKFTKSLVLDADALWALSEIGNDAFFAARDLFLTPHPGEAATLDHVPTKDVLRNLAKIALNIAQKYKANVLLKSHVTHLATPKPSLALLPYPNAAMASAGIGDVLAGTLAAVTAQARGGAFTQWLDANGIAAVALSAHSRAGRAVARRRSVVTACDLIEDLHV